MDTFLGCLGGALVIFAVLYGISLIVKADNTTIKIVKDGKRKDSN